MSQVSRRITAWCSNISFLQLDCPHALLGIVSWRWSEKCNLFPLYEDLRRSRRRLQLLVRWSAPPPAILSQLPCSTLNHASVAIHLFINTRRQTHCRTFIFPAESPVIMMCSFQLWIHQIGLSAPSINTLHYTIYNYLHRCHDSHLGLSKNEISCSDQQPAIFLSPSLLSPTPTLALQFSIFHFRVAQWGAPLKN